ncbi:hypothetical protein [Nannocystis exedens]|uniref:hypothetical protein n=1 Tax=Nannocystis exedens TaxID=54 RepID=UPI0011604BBB|nr:hypothetical protein [Nannocystis exedens]
MLSKTCPLVYVLKDIEDTPLATLVASTIAPLRGADARARAIAAPQPSSARDRFAGDIRHVDPRAPIAAR